MKHLLNQPDLQHDLVQWCNGATTASFCRTKSTRAHGEQNQESRYELLESLHNFHFHIQRTTLVDSASSVFWFRKCLQLFASALSPTHHAYSSRPGRRPSRSALMSHGPPTLLDSLPRIDCLLEERVTVKRQRYKSTKEQTD